MSNDDFTHIVIIEGQENTGQVVPIQVDENGRLLATGIPGDPGAAGPPGLPITWRGEYNAGTSYAVNDAVSYNGSSYICVLASTGGHLPTDPTYFNEMAQKGANGSQGPPGESGGVGMPVLFAQIVAYAVDITQVRVGQPISFGLAINSQYPIVTYSWVWGDGSANGTTASPSHYFGTSGAKTITCTITDSQSNVTTCYFDITIQSALSTGIPQGVMAIDGPLGQSVTTKGYGNDLGISTDKTAFIAPDDTPISLSGTVVGFVNS